MSRSLGGPRPGRFLGVVLAVVIAAGCTRPNQIDNLVLVTIDTLRADHLGSYGYPRPTNPSMSQSTGSARGARNADSYSGSTYTTCIIPTLRPRP
ncbi:MAG: sulfatase-like hydrolase/transferase, partial [Acidobacteriota bacterium]